LTHATVALVVRDSAHPDTAGVALGLTGSEGAVGLQQALGMGTGVFTLQVQTGGTAWKIDGAALARMAQCNLPMLLTFGRYLWTVSQEVAATAANAQLHGVHQRLAAWIFLSATRGRANELFLTHAHLADMLGVRRASVTEAALLLKDRGLVDYQRGLIHILDLPGLRLVAQ
jgi:CRP-like cAMP-binding protein